VQHLLGPVLGLQTARTRMKAPQVRMLVLLAALLEQVLVHIAVLQV
jgi:hypothetical protein